MSYTHFFLIKIRYAFQTLCTIHKDHFLGRTIVFKSAVLTKIKVKIHSASLFSSLVVLSFSGTIFIALFIVGIVHRLIRKIV